MKTSFCISIALSVIILNTKMAFLVPASSTNPNCSTPISGFICSLPGEVGFLR